MPSRKRPENSCGYCETPNATNRCSACRKIYYCNRECQVKHWKVEHKIDCKKRKNMTDKEWEDYQIQRTIKILQNGGRTSSERKKMHLTRVWRELKSMPQDALIFPLTDEEMKITEFKDPENAPTSLAANMQMKLLMDVFDKDNDNKLNFDEWCCMLRALSFDASYGDGSNGYLVFLFDFWQDLGWQFPYEASLSTGVFGSYIYPHTREGLERMYIKNMRFGWQEIVETFRVIAYLFTIKGKRIDVKRTGTAGRTKDMPYDYHGEESYNHAFDLMFQFAQYAWAVKDFSRVEISKEDLWHSLQYVDGMSFYISDLIHSYYTFYPKKFVIGWKTIPFVNGEEDQETLYKVYDKWQFQKKRKTPAAVLKKRKEVEKKVEAIKLKNFLSSSRKKRLGKKTGDSFDKDIFRLKFKQKRRLKYDIIYILKVDDDGISNLHVNFQVCHNPDMCEKTMGYPSRVRNMMAVTDKCCIGMMPGDIVNDSFGSYKEHAILIAYVILYHEFDPKLCHSIYIGKNINVSTENHQKVIDAFNKICGTKVICNIGDEVHRIPFGGLFGFRHD